MDIYVDSGIAKLGDSYVDTLSIIFIAVGLLGATLATLAFVLGRKVKNGYRNSVVGLSIFTIFLFVGTLVLGIIAFNPICAERTDAINYYHNPCAWICLGLGSGTALFGILDFIIHLATKNIVVNPKEEKIIKGAEIEKEASDCLFYQEFSQGAIEVKEDYIIFYKNWLNFTKFKKGRVATIIFINDIQHITYKGSGWLTGTLKFTFKHANKPIGINFSKWFVWRSKKLNTKVEPIYKYIRGRVINNNK